MASAKNVITRLADLPSYRINRWYKQAFSDEVLFFFAEAEQKNGGLAGILVRLDLMRPRAAPKATKDSIPKAWMNLWRVIPSEEVPASVVESFNRKKG